jgi:acyl transferase domain-containing protein
VGQINKKGKFDAGFFGIHRRQSTALDVMTRLVLERSYEAIVDAGKLVTLTVTSSSANTCKYGRFCIGMYILLF